MKTTDINTSIDTSIETNINTIDNAPDDGAVPAGFDELFPF